MDVRGILKARFGHHTKLVHSLCREIQDLERELRQRRVAVLLVAREDVVDCYAGRRAVVECVHFPKGSFKREAATMVEEAVRLALPGTHRRLAFDVHAHKGILRPSACKSLKAFVDGLERQEEFAWWDEIERLMREP